MMKRALKSIFSYSNKSADKVWGEESFLHRNGLLFLSDCHTLENEKSARSHLFCYLQTILKYCNLNTSLY